MLFSFWILPVDVVYRRAVKQRSKYHMDLERHELLLGSSNPCFSPCWPLVMWRRQSGLFFYLRGSTVVRSQTNGNQVGCQSHSGVSCSAQQPLSRSTLKDNRPASLPPAYLTPFTLYTLHLTPKHSGFQTVHWEDAASL